MFLNNTFDSIQFDLNSLCIKNVNYSSTTRVPTPYSSGSSSDLYHSHSSGSSKVGTTPTRVGNGQKKGECNTLLTTKNNLLILPGQMLVNIVKIDSNGLEYVLKSLKG
jgi:hypothetical protein